MTTSSEELKAQKKEVESLRCKDVKLPEVSIFSNGHVVKYFNLLQGGL